MYESESVLRKGVDQSRFVVIILMPETGMLTFSRKKVCEFVLFSGFFLFLLSRAGKMQF